MEHPGCIPQGGTTLSGTACVLDQLLCRQAAGEGLTRAIQVARDRVERLEALEAQRGAERGEE